MVRQSRSTVLSAADRNSRFSFGDVTAESGLAQQPPTYQAAWVDFDNDGDLDLASAGKLFVNEGGANRWLKVRLLGDGKSVNRSAIGAQVRVRFGAETLVRQVEAGTGEGNQNDLTLHFGLGPQTGPVEVEVLWPGGKSQTIKGVETNKLLEVKLA